MRALLLHLLMILSACDCCTATGAPPGPPVRASRESHQPQSSSSCRAVQVGRARLLQARRVCGVVEGGLEV